MSRDSDNKPPNCHADRDGDCVWRRCPQANDYQPGRHCPLDVYYNDWNEPDPDDIARREAYLAAHPLVAD
jgi:hypothetical protein